MVLFTEKYYFVAVFQNATSGTDTLRRQLSNHWTLIGDMAFIETQIETPVSNLFGVCAVCLIHVQGGPKNGLFLKVCDSHIC